MFARIITLYYRYFTTLCFGILFQVFFALPSQGTHIVGGEIYYKFLGNDRYEITLIVYRDCYNGIPGLDDPAWVSIFYNNFNYTWRDTLVVPLMSDSVIPPAISSPCLIPPVDVCYEIGTYKDTVTLPPSPSGYWLVYQRCCRNHTIQNIISPDMTGATYTAFIPGTNTFSINSNPRFKIVPPSYSFICLNYPFIFDNSAIDNDTNALGLPSDSLVYSLCNPWDYEGFFNNIPQPKPPFQPPYAIVNWKPPYSLNNLIGGVPLIIDAQTGLLTCTPSTIGQFVFGVCVDEYRNGVYLSTTRRDYQLNVVPCPDITVAAIQTPILHCEDMSVTFTNQSVNAATYFWNFGDTTVTSDTSNALSPTYLYPDTGIYNVQLIAYSGINPACNDTIEGIVNVYPGYKIAFQANKTPCSPIVSFNDSILAGPYATSSRTWDFGDGTSSIIEDPVHTFPGPGSYLVNLTGTSNKGCKDSMSITIVLNYVTTNISAATPDSCFNACNGTATVSTLSGIAPFIYQWNDPQLQTTAVASGLCAGNFQVVITDSAGCKDSSNALINQPTPLISILKSFTDYCNHACVGSVQSLISGGNGGYAYQWSDPQQQTTSNAVNLCNGTYTITVTDSKGCTVMDTISVNYTDSMPVVLATADMDTLYIGQQTYIHATHANGYIYSWSPSATLSSGFIADPLSSPSVTTTYNVQVTDSNGCIVNDQVTIFVLDVICREPAIFVPNAFTPNNDLNNDVLLVRSNVIQELYFTIYDRWGEQVFETTDQMKGWDGNYKGKKVGTDVFDYYLKAVCYDKSEYYHKGNITLIR